MTDYEGYNLPRTYNSHWLSQFGLYKYESPEIAPKKPPNYHQRVAIYGSIGMLAVLFFVAYVLVNEATIKRRLIVTNYVPINETAIESSLNENYLTTPFSNQFDDNLEEAETIGIVESITIQNGTQRQSRKLDLEEEDLDEVTVNVDDAQKLIFIPTSKTPATRRINSRFYDDQLTAETYRPRPFNYPLQGIAPSGFKRLNYSNENSIPFAQIPRQHQEPANNIQDILQQVSGPKQYFHYQQQPSEFGNPRFKNHRVKFSGVYRTPRKVGDVRTLFDSSSKQRHFAITKPYVINQLMAPTSYIPDPLHKYKPHFPSEVNLMADKQFRFAPSSDNFDHVYQQIIDINNNLKDETTERKTKTTGKPFSLMLDIYPMPEDKKKQNQNTFIKTPPTTPSYFNNNNYAQIQQQNDYFNDNYFRNTAYYNRQMQSADESYRTVPYYNRQTQGYEENVSSKPSQILVHMNLYPKTKNENWSNRQDLNTEESRRFKPLQPFRPQARSSELLTDEIEILPTKRKLTTTATTTTTTTTELPTTTTTTTEVPTTTTTTTTPKPTTTTSTTTTTTTTTTTARPTTTIATTKTPTTTTYKPIPTPELKSLPLTSEIEIIKSIEVPTNITFDNIHFQFDRQYYSNSALIDGAAIYVPPTPLDFSSNIQTQNTNHNTGETTLQLPQTEFVNFQQNDDAVK